MIAEIIAIGNELLSGLSAETNSKYLINQLKLSGILTKSVAIIGDNADDITKALATVEANTDIILVTGGLGPTHDDITMKTAAKYFDSKIN